MQQDKLLQNNLLKGEKILVTGASGFIGSALCKKLSNHGAIVYGTTRQKVREKSNIKWETGDLTNTDFVNNLIKNICPDFIFHLASYVTGSRDVEHVLPTFKNNLLTTVNLLSAVHTNIKKSKRIIIIGSSEEPNLDEGNAIPASPYASAKIASSNYARMFYNLYGTPVSIAKIFMVYGPGQKDHNKLLPYVILNTFSGEPPKVSSGNRLIDWIYLDDVVDGLINMLDSSFNIHGKTIDLGSGELISVKEITNLTINLINPKLKAYFGAVEDRPFEQTRVANIEKTHQQINWRPKIDLEEGLIKKIVFFKKVYQKANNLKPIIKKELSKDSEKLLNFNKAKELQKQFNKVIPGGCHTYAKGDDQYPEFMPPYIVKGKGCRVWDVDGNEYIEYGMGLRSITLGHAFHPVVNAAYEQMLKGTNFNRPATIELEYAEEFLDLFKGAEMVKFGKNGSDANNGAVRLARAYTGRDMIAVCADHPFFSVDDWFIGTTAMSAGIPQAIKELTVKFNYNDIESVVSLFAKYPEQIACIILEPEKYSTPQDNYLQKLKKTCHQNGALLVFDEMISGFRAHLGGGQTKYNIVPDLSTFGKAMGNGFSISALTGKRKIMELGGQNHDKEFVFLLSLTHGAETHSLAAARATLRFYKEHDVIKVLAGQGRKIKEKLTKVAEELNLNDYFKIIGPDYDSVYTTLDQNKEHSESFRTLFLQETMKRGLLMPSTVISYSHDNRIIEETAEKVFDALIIYKKALENGIEKYLKGRPVKPAIRKYK